MDFRVRQSQPQPLKSQMNLWDGHGHNWIRVIEGIRWHTQHSTLKQSKCSTNGSDQMVAMTIVRQVEKEEEFGKTCVQGQSEGANKDSMKHEDETKTQPVIYTYWCPHWTSLTMRNIKRDSRKLNVPSKTTACLLPPKPNSHRHIFAVDILFGVHLFSFSFCLFTLLVW